MAKFNLYQVVRYQNGEQVSATKQMRFADAWNEYLQQMYNDLPFGHRPGSDKRKKVKRSYRYFDISRQSFFKVHFVLA